MDINIDEIKGKFDKEVIDNNESEELNAFIAQIRNNLMPKEFYGKTRNGMLVFVKKFDSQKRAIILKDISSKKIYGYFLGNRHDDYMRYLKKIL